MNVSNQMMARLAALSKLELSKEESEQFSGQLETVVNYMDILAKLPSEPTNCETQTELLHNVFREDRVIRSNDRAELLSNAPQTDGVTLIVPKAVE